MLYRSVGRHAEAADWLERYRASAPLPLPLLQRLARADIAANRPAVAVSLLTAALAYYPDETTLYELLYETYKDGRRWREAAHWARRCLRLNPANPRMQLALFDAAARLLDFESIRALCAGYVSALSRHAGGDARLALSLLDASDMRPMHAALFFESDWLTARAAERASVRLGMPQPAASPKRAAVGARKIRIGYLSGDFNDHPVMQLMRGFFRRHDTQDFEVQLFSYGRDDGSAYRAELKQWYPNFVDLERASDAEAAAAIRGRELDVLVELKGWTRFTRMGIAARRPAPVQIGYLGFPGTSGGEFMDYLIADRIVAPPEGAAHYREKLLYMPACYLVTDDADPVAPPPSRAQFGLPADAFVLCSFNRSLKISEENLRAWMEILRRAPRALLWLSVAAPAERDNARRFAQGQGVDPARLIFAERVEGRAQHLARIGLADLALDTWRYNGHTSTVDALWAGVPVLATTGVHFASRVSESILAAAGLSQMLARSPADYVDRAVAFATGARDIAVERAAVATARRGSALFDTARFTRDFLALVAGAVR